MQVEPKVFLIGKSVIDPTATREWLDSVGAEGYILEAGVTPAEQLVQLCGKRCYKSFVPGLNPNVQRVRNDMTEFIDNILKVGHGCYDIETEVLTETGWKKWPNVTKEDKLATRSQSGNIHYHYPSNLVSYEYTGRMYKIDGHSVDLLVTPNHNLLVSLTTKLRDRLQPDFQLLPAELVGNQNHIYTKHANWSYKGSRINTGVLQLIGFAIGDGYMDSSRRVKFHLKRKRKIDYLRKICKEANLVLKEKIDNKYDVLLPKQYRNYFEQIYTTVREKQIPQNLITSLDKTSLAFIYKGLISSDGSIATKGKSVVYDTTSSILAGQFQQLCLHLGLAANISQASSYKLRNDSFGNKPIFSLNIATDQLYPEINRYKGSRSKSSWIDTWQGMVYCAEVPNHTLYVRRNGKPVWCGNSVLEHVTFNFAIENISRVATAELNRHRAGVAISEGSMRYIRFDDIPYWVPTSIDGPDIFNPVDLSPYELKQWQSRVIFQKAFVEAAANYKTLCELWKEELAPESTFHAKKQITSMMRRIIPMGVASGGVWSLNLRALRHVFHLRCDESAEEEIILIASMMLEKMIETEPILFKDFCKNDKGFWRAKYIKV